MSSMVLGSVENFLLNEYEHYFNVILDIRQRILHLTTPRNCKLGRC